MTFNKWQLEDQVIAKLPITNNIDNLPTNLNWYYILKKAKKEGVATLLYQNISRLEINIPQDVLLELKNLKLAVTSRNIIFAQKTRDILHKFNDNNIRCMLLKGILLTKFIYEDIGSRGMADIDLLVMKGDVKKVDAILKTLGYATNDFIPNSQDNKFSIYRNSAIYTNNDTLYPSIIHLHWHLVNASIPLFIYLIDIKDIWQSAKEINFDGAIVYIMPPYHLILHLAEHAMKHSFSALIYPVDLAYLIKLYEDIEVNSQYKTIFPHLDWDLVFKYARLWKLKEPLFYSLFFISELLGVNLPIEIRSQIKNCRFGFEGRYLIQSLELNNRWNGLSIFGYLSMAKTLINKLRFISQTLFPPTCEMRNFGKDSNILTYVKRLCKAIEILISKVS